MVLLLYKVYINYYYINKNIPIKVMNIKILADIDFQTIIGESMAQTQTGAELLNKYKSYLMVNEASCALINSFVKEAVQHTYDNGVNEALTTVAEYINDNKASWALATACESINANRSSYNYINRNAAKQVEKLLEMDEQNVVKYVKNGALKNVMFCEAFRNIAKQIFKETPMVEAQADYVVKHPVSFVESVGDGLCFAIEGKIYKIDDDKNITESTSNEVSNTFRTIATILESSNTTIDGTSISVVAGNSIYTISEAGKCEKCKLDKPGSYEGDKVAVKKDATLPNPDNSDDSEASKKKGVKESFETVSQLRENNRLVLMTANPRFRNQLAYLLEGIALIAENYDNIANMDNVTVYESKNDRFLVIEGSDKLYATLLASNRHPKWTINENAVDTLAFIKAKTNMNISENYSELVKKHIETVSESQQESIKEELKNQTIQSYKERIEMLTEKFKNDPTKLAVLSNIAQELMNIEE